MDKTKKNGILKAAACVFGSTMLMTCVLGGTLAKYVSSGTAAETKAEVATWDIQVDNKKLTDTLELDLSDLTITSTGAQANEGPYTDKPAPGSWGYKEIEVSNQSDVDAKISISGAGAVNNDSSITVAVVTDDGGDGFTKDDITSADMTEKTATVKAKGTATLYVAYNWEFVGQDEADTKLGTGEENDGKIDFGSITVKAEQAKYSA